MPVRSFSQRYLGDPLAALAVLLFFGIFAALPVDWASALGGWLARLIGPRLAVAGRARANLTRIFPAMAEPEIANTLRGMWDNLGRTIAEQAHLGRFDPYRADSRVEIIGAEIVDALRDDGRPGMFFSGHIGNWEIASLAITRRRLPVHIAYRAANNPLIDRLFRRSRATLGEDFFAKGAQGARQALAALRDGGHLAMLVDQKMNDGIAVPFLGHDAMTAPALAQMALKYDCPVVPVRVERLGGAHFRITLLPAIALARSGDKQADIAAMMAEVNRLLGEWIRERPAQWLWLHNRWP